MAWWTWGAVNGALIRRVPASVVNVSSRGCLIETAAPLLPGTVGLLEVADADGAHGEAVRVCHTLERPGSAMPFRAGTEFLVLDAPAAVSVRERAARLERSLRPVADPAAGPPRLVPAGENSGGGRTTPKAAAAGSDAGTRATAGDYTKM
jgi:hypothetical protein